MFKKVAIDVDEVLVNLLKPMAKWKRYSLPTNRKYNYLYREIFNVTEEESQEILRGFYSSNEFIDLKPILGSQYAMCSLKKQCKKMYIVTGRQEIVREKTELWLDTFFPGIFDDVILTNSFTENEIKKVDICRALNIDYIIDDNIQICKECIDSGMNATNFIGDVDIYPWCNPSEISMRGWGGNEKDVFIV
jgi:5'(3')-deoxyribonucleotidase